MNDKQGEGNYLKTNLLKLKKELLELQKKKNPSNIEIKLTDAEVYDLFKEYSEASKDDIKANYKDNLLNYSDLKEETKKEIFETILVIEYGNYDPVVIIDDIIDTEY